MSARVRGARALSEAMEQVLSSTREELLIGFGHWSVEDGWLLLVGEARLATDEEVVRDAAGLHWTGELTSRIYAQANKAGQGILLLHAHGGGRRPPELSTTDEETVDELMPHFGLVLPDAPHAYAVVNRTHVCGWMQRGEERRPLQEIRCVATGNRSWASSGSRHGPLPRDDRQAAALGKGGVARLRRASIAVVGLGGAGSQVVEMLAHAGAGHLILADSDHIEEVNLSRTHGAYPGDVGAPKVEIAERLIRAISSDTRVTVARAAFPTRELATDMRNADVAIGCVDSAHARNELNKFALRYALPLLDVGTTITPKPLSIDGHLTRVLPSSSCLRCFGHVSEALLAEEQDAARRGDYGLGEGRPQVVSFNGLLASAAVTEALKIVSGFAGELAGSEEWHYSPVTGELRKIKVLMGPCTDCQWYGMKADQVQ